MHVAVKGQLTGVGSLLLPCPGLDLSHHARQQGPLPTEPSFLPELSDQIANLLYT